MAETLKTDISKEAKCETGMPHGVGTRLSSNESKLQFEKWLQNENKAYKRLHDSSSFFLCVRKMKNKNGIERHWSNVKKRQEWKKKISINYYFIEPYKIYRVPNKREKCVFWRLKQIEK